MKQLAYGMLLFIACMTTFAATDKNVLKPKITLNHLKTIEAKELNGDELYFDITEMRANEPGKFYRIPEHPIHWSSSQLTKLKKVKLWSEEIQPGKIVILLFSLMEEDDTPFNPDDMIGVVRVELKNKDGVLSVHWTIPNRAVGPVTIKGEKGDIQKFSLNSEDGSYEVFLSLEK